MITSAARVTPTPIPAFAPVDNVPGGCVATSVKFPRLRAPVALADADAHRPSFETTVQTAPFEQQPPSSSSHENWPCEQFGSWIVATVVGGAMKEPHCPPSMQDWPLGQHPASGHLKLLIPHILWQQPVTAVWMAIAGVAVMGPVCEPPGTRIVVMMVLIHRYSSFWRSGH